MVGALSKVWPWQETLSWRTNSAGHQVPLSQTPPVTPETWTTLYGQDPPQILLASLMAALGLALVLVIELAGKKATPAESGSA